MNENKRLLTILKSTLQFTSTDKLRQNINGIRFEFTDDNINLIATDGHTLIVFTIKSNTPEYLLFLNAFDNILKKDKSFTVHNNSIKNWIKLKNLFHQYKTQDIIQDDPQGRFPDYKRLIPVKDYDNDTAIALFSAPIKINPDYIARISNVYSLFTKCSEIQGFEFYGVRAPISWKAKNDDFTCLVLIMPINT